MHSANPAVAAEDMHGAQHMYIYCTLHSVLLYGMYVQQLNS